MAVAEEPTRRLRGRIVEAVVCAVLLVTVALVGLQRMDYLGEATAHHVRMTDNSRSAYVAKNVVEGNGYTTHELPAFLLDFYDREGKLHGERWVNADRFPFTTWAIAALYTVTGSTSWQVGILGYNVLCFVIAYLALYLLARSLWRDRWAVLATMGLALLHPLAYVYPLYMKDADMLALTIGVMAAFHRYLTRRPEDAPWKLAIAMGTLLAWLFLDRPNVGGAFVLCFAAIGLYRLWRARRIDGLGPALRATLRLEGVAAAAFVVWCLPFAIHSLAEWGSPFFSANATYQQPLGTRFAMDTDTWYKYSEPGVPVTLGTLAEEARGQLISKFTSSWLMTLKVMLRSFALELILTCGLIAWLARRAAKSDGGEAAAAELTRDRAFIAVAQIVGVVVVLNLALLPLYGYQDYAYRHYLSFCMPLLWLAGGRAIVALARALRPAVGRIREHLRAHGVVWALAAVALIAAWNFGRPAQDTHPLFLRTANLLGKHWLLFTCVLAGLLLARRVARVPRYPLAVVLVTGFVLVWLKPFYEIKRHNLNWFPADTAVWDVLRQRQGLVMSFALQGEVNWVSDRRNIPAPELAMHVYSFLFDHRLEVEDVYIESAEAMIGPYDGPFYGAAPGFESYARLQRFQGRLPGYELVHHHATTKRYPKYRVRKARPKASTVYRLADREAVRAMAQSPSKLELGRVDNVVHTAYGWGNYYTLDGKPAVAATSEIHDRYAERPEGQRPAEATSATFFLDDRRPAVVELEIFATHATTLDFYWNLDLYYYDAPGPRRRKRIGSYHVEQPGWQRVRLEVPPELTRRGLNKLGFASSAFRPVTVCPKATPLGACAGIKLDPADEPIPLHAENISEPAPITASVFVGTLHFHYAGEAATAGAAVDAAAPK